MHESDTSTMTGNWLSWLAVPQWLPLQHADSLTSACNRVAFLLATNTPFYPLYLWFILGRAGWPWLLLSLCSLPFFSATPWVSRRNGMAGRVWLGFFASLNSAWIDWLLGPRAGIALFFLPCLVLTVLAFRTSEIWPRALLTGLPFVLYAALHWAPPPPAIYSAAAYSSLLTLSAVSVTGLSVVIPYMLGAARGEG